jgi:single-stranded-DNA-specific exonuclease
MLTALLPESTDDTPVLESSCTEDTRYLLKGRRSVLGQRWRLRHAPEKQVLAAMQQHDLPELLARVVVGRGIGLEAMASHLSPTLRDLMPDPSHFLDMEKAAARVADAVEKGERLAIFGDYDVDGATSSALLRRYFRALGTEPVVYIPDRLAEGYGPNVPAMQHLARDRQCRVIITVDCGTVAFEPIAAAKAAGAEVVVLDHHQSEIALPEAAALVNPNRFDEVSPYRHLAAVGMCFLFTVAMNRELRRRGAFTTRKEPNLLELLDLVALGTVCDVVPLTTLNRAFVAQGLKVLAARNNAGLRALSDIGGVKETPTAYHLGFVLGPRINAGGRVGKADLGMRILSTEDEEEALALAQELNHLNAERRALEALTLEEAIEQAERSGGNQPLLMVAAEHWHPGVIGIVAGRLKERYQQPVAVLAIDDKGIGKASCRSVPGVDFGQAVTAAKQAGLLLGGGGHAMAAGFSVARDKMAELHSFFNQRMEAGVTAHGLERSLELDGCLALGGVTVELAKSLERAGPYGAGNPGPRFLLQGVRIARADTVGDSHLRCLLADPAGASNAPLVKCMIFRAAESGVGQALAEQPQRLWHLAVQLRLNQWQGRETAELQVEDAMPAND